MDLTNYIEQGARNFLEEVNNCLLMAAKDPALALLNQHLQILRGERRRVFMAGNGASSSISSTLAFKLSFESGLPTYSLSDPNLVVGATRKTSYSGWIQLALERLAVRGDVAFITSSSGESSNAVEAGKWARANGVGVVSFTGFLAENQLRSCSDFSFWVPSLSYNVVETVHLASGLCLAHSLAGGSPVEDSLLSIARDVSELLDSKSRMDAILDLAEIAQETAARGGKLVFIGEGSSISSAAHSATDFTKSGLKSIAISDSNLITAMMNDFGRDAWLVKGLERYTEEGDLVVLLMHDSMTLAEEKAVLWCGSNSRNVVAIGGTNSNSRVNSVLRQHHTWSGDNQSGNLIIPSVTNLAIADGLLRELHERAD